MSIDGTELSTTITLPSDGEVTDFLNRSAETHFIFSAPEEINDFSMRLRAMQSPARTLSYAGFCADYSDKGVADIAQHLSERFTVLQVQGVRWNANASSTSRAQKHRAPPGRKSTPEYDTAIESRDSVGIPAHPLQERRTLVRKLIKERKSVKQIANEIRESQGTVKNDISWLRSRNFLPKLD
jgi:hypothetical protein